MSLNHTSVFRVIPSEDAASASATFYVVNASAIDYETGPREYVIQVSSDVLFVFLHLFLYIYITENCLDLEQCIFLTILKMENA